MPNVEFRPANVSVKNHLPFRSWETGEIVVWAEGINIGLIYWPHKAAIYRFVESIHVIVNGKQQVNRGPIWMARHGGVPFAGFAPSADVVE